jgi:hypothetical protein
LGVRGVHRDDDPVCIPRGHAVQQCLDLGDLLRVGRDLYLRDRDALAVEHRGEQRELLVLGGPRAAEHLTVDRGSHQALGTAAHPFVQPCPDRHIKRGGVNIRQHATDRVLARRAELPLKPTPHATQLP